MDNTPQRTSAERDALKRITPPKRLPLTIGRALRAVEAAIKREQLLASVTVGGSIAKGTYLRGDHDIDVFVRFSTDYTDAEISDHLERVLRKAFRKVERVHGSRDYFHVTQDGYTFEFIPVLKIDSWEEARNVTDMSPLHVDYVRSKVEARPWLSQDIRLTKLFCKAAKVYGAESYIGGLSGHVIDLLIINYGSFRALLDAAASWPAKVVLDPEAHLENPMTQLNDAKTLAPLVIVDPVQQDRNSAAAVSKDAFDRFRNRAREYLAADTKAQSAFFTVTALDPKRFMREHAGADGRSTNIITVMATLTPLPGKKDVVGAKCLKVHEHVIRGLLDAEFTIVATAWEFTPKRATLLYAFPTTPLPADIDVEGPPVHKTQDVARFAAAHKTTFTKDGRIHALDARKHREPMRLIQLLLAHPYVGERVKAARCKALGIRTKKKI